MNSLLPTTAQAASAGCELVTRDGRALALVAATLRGEAQGGLARLVLEQRFENPYDDTLKVTYRMPLPADGAISGYEFVIGERVIKGQIDKKRQARERFERALASGRTAALLEQERSDIFTQLIGNIPPREAVVARITVDQRLAWLPEGEWELRFPTVIGPRYIGSADTAEDVRATHIKVTDKPLPVAIQIEIAIRDAIVAGAKPSSPSHLIEKRGDVVELKSGSRLDRDIVVRWPVATPAPGLSIATARPASGNDAYALLTIVPPAKEAHPVAVPRDLIVLLDTSGSMSGGPLDKAKQVVAMLIDSLDEHDRLELIEFSNSPRRYLTEPVMATSAAKQAAINWVRTRVADGGTEMRAGVIEALQTLRVGAQRQVIVVTDGYVGGEHQILEALNRRLPKSCRLHVLGVGSAVNRSIATSLSRAGRGVEVIVGIDEDAERGAKRLLDRTKSPMLTNVEISGSAVLRHAPAQMPDCFERAPLVCALAIKPEGGEILVRGQLARDSWEQRITVKPLRAGDGNQAIVALYGRERVADVEAAALFSTVDGEVEELGLTFQIATRMTSWVAIDEIRREVGTTREQVVPQELPYGTTASAFGLRGAIDRSIKTQAGMVSAAPMSSMHLARMVTTEARESFEGSFDREQSTDADAMASIAPAGAAYDDDFDDAPAPGGMLGGAPPPPAALRRPSPGYAGPASMRPPASSGYMPPSAPPPAAPRSPIPRQPISGDDEFENEAPTGEVFQDEAKEASAFTRDTARMQAVPAPEAAEHVEVERELASPQPVTEGPLRQRRSTIPGIAAPQPQPPTRPAPQQPSQEIARLAYRVDEPQPVVQHQARKKVATTPRAIWLALALLLALIALLSWWLAA